VAPLYDLMLMIDSSAPQEQQEQVAREVRSMIESDGELVGAHDWGSRRLAYEIDHRREAGYHLFQFHGPPDLLDRLRQSLRIMDGVLRFRIIRLKPGAPPPPKPDREGPGPREEAGERTVAAARAAADAPPAGDQDEGGE
jgi:small subunit ribosomal protein S6